MKKVTFITGNQGKADYLSKYLGYDVEHVKLDLDEIQSTSLQEIVEHKVKQAYDLIKTPVIVEDVALDFEAWGGLPGPFIKFFIENNSLENICSMLEGKSRNATARCVYGYYDGKNLELLEGSLNGKISYEPSGDNGYGWDRIFIPEGYDETRASLDELGDKETYMKIKPFKELKEFLEG